MLSLLPLQSCVLLFGHSSPGFSHGWLLLRSQLKRHLLREASPDKLALITCLSEHPVLLQARSPPPGYLLHITSNFLNNLVFFFCLYLSSPLESNLHITELLVSLKVHTVGAR